MSSEGLKRNYLGYIDSGGLVYRNSLTEVGEGWLKVVYERGEPVIPGKVSEIKNGSHFVKKYHPQWGITEFEEKYQIQKKTSISY